MIIFFSYTGNIPVYGFASFMVIASALGGPRPLYGGVYTVGDMGSCIVGGLHLLRTYLFCVATFTVCCVLLLDGCVHPSYAEAGCIMSNLLSNKAPLFKKETNPFTTNL
jgi:hypothetical protein